MSDWMTIRVVLSGQSGHALAQPPGRVLLAHADHTLAELSEAIDTGFGRWDLTPLHSFEVDGRTLLSAEAETDAGEDSDDVTLGEVGLRAGLRFTYAFDLGEGWTHDCTVEATGVRPDALTADEPDRPTPVYGWGTIPDQYGVLVEDGGEDVTRAGVATPGDAAADDDEDDEASWRAAAAASWGVVARALAAEPRERDDDALAAAAAALRARAARGQADDGEIGTAVLFDAAALDLDDDAVRGDDAELWTQLAAAVVEPEGDVDLDDDLVAAWTSLEPADWAGAVIELVRSGAGTVASPDALIELVERCPEVEGDELTEDDEAVLLEGLEVVVALWQELGALDADGALTRLGLWGLPRSLERAWTGA